VAWRTRARNFRKIEESSTHNQRTNLEKQIESGGGLREVLAVPLPVSHHSHYEPHHPFEPPLSLWRTVVVPEVFRLRIPWAIHWVYDRPAREPVASGKDASRDQATDLVFRAPMSQECGLVKSDARVHSTIGKGEAYGESA
jgi:hypothetical protein